MWEIKLLHLNIKNNMWELRHHRGHKKQENIKKFCEQKKS